MQVHNRTTHGKKGSQIYNVWRAIKSRCLNTNHKYYKDYGGRGITMQENWIKDFQTFYDYVSKLDNYDESNMGYKGITIDRIKNNGNYCEGNLRWVSMQMQTRNRRMNKSNKSGYRGVHFSKSSNRYRAGITYNGVFVYLGMRKDAKEAYQLRVDYIRKYNIKGFEVE